MISNLKWLNQGLRSRFVCTASAIGFVHFTFGVPGALTAPELKSNGGFLLIPGPQPVTDVAVLILGLPKKANPVNWRPLDTRKVSPEGVESRAVLHLQLDTASTTEITAEVERQYPGCSIRWINPASVRTEALVIDSKNGQTLKALSRNQAGGDSYIFNESGYEFSFVLTASDLAKGGDVAVEEDKTQGIFDRLYADKGDVGILIEVTAYVEDRGAGGLADFQLEVQKLGEALKGVAEWEQEKLVEKLWNSGALTPSKNELRENLVVPVEIAAIATLEEMHLVESKKIGPSTRYTVREGLEKFRVKLKGAATIGISGTVRFSLDSLLE